MSKNQSQFLSVLGSDFLASVLLALIALVLGLAMNRFRAMPLPMRHVPKEERLQNAVSALNNRPTRAAELRYVMPEELGDLMTRMPLVILDARPELLYRRGHIPGALPLPRETFRGFYEQHRAQLEMDKTRALVVYCQSDECEDGELVAKALTQLGFQSVSILAGGWDGWQARIGQ